MKTLLQNLDQIKQKRVLVRCNFDVPIDDGVVQDSTRIEDAIPTIKLLLENQATVILLAHAGRPDGQPDPTMSLKPILPVLEKLLSRPVNFLDYTADYSNLKPESLNLPARRIGGKPETYLRENLRFWPGEEANDHTFAQALSQLGDIYINESFATSHRAHASITGIPQHLPGFAGLSLEKEVTTITQVKSNPKKPLVVVIGGAKLETKEPLVTTFAETADSILVGGKVALDMQQHHLQSRDNIHVAELTPNGKDITETSARQFAEIIKQAGTVIWNGAMGVFEEEDNRLGTQLVAEAVNHTEAFTLVGGGDTEAALTVFKQEDHINHISMGGGAMLELLTQPSLPGIDALA